VNVRECFHFPDFSHFFFPSVEIRKDEVSYQASVVAANERLGREVTVLRSELERIRALCRLFQNQSEAFIRSSRNQEQAASESDKEEVVSPGEPALLLGKSSQGATASTLVHSRAAAQATHDAKSTSREFVVMGTSSFPAFPCLTLTHSIFFFFFCRICGYLEPIPAGAETSEEKDRFGVDLADDCCRGGRMVGGDCDFRQRFQAWAGRASERGL
jgi:hypothetical protein